MEPSVALAIMQFSAYTAGIPLLAGIIGWSHLRRGQRYIMYLVIFSITIELLALILGRLLHLPNLFLLHVFTVGQFYLLWSIFRQRLIPPFSRKIFSGLLIFFLLFAVASAIWLDGLFQFNTHARSVSAVLVILMCLTYYYQRLTRLDLEDLESDPLFWISTGSLVYFSGGLVMFIVSNYVAKNEGMSLTMWAVHAILNTFNYLFLTIALWVRPTN